MADAAALRARAAAIADEVLFPAARDVDAADRVPAAHLDLLAAEGFYGVATADFATTAAVLEAFAGGCLATAFVWLQHHGPVRAVASSAEPGIRQHWLAPLAEGVKRGGIALAGLAPGGTLRAVETPDGFRLTGETPWVTGWDMIDVVHVGVRDDHDQVRFLLVDASAFAYRAAGTLAVRTGSRSVLRDQHAQRLAREAMFLLVFGSRPAIREALLHRFAEGDD
jgi:alkylation response protein AidB-like acyl-CoA dehydrogenase